MLHFRAVVDAAPKCANSGAKIGGGRSLFFERLVVLGVIKDGQRVPHNFAQFLDKGPDSETVHTQLCVRLKEIQEKHLIVSRGHFIEKTAAGRCNLKLEAQSLMAAKTT